MSLLVRKINRSKWPKEEDLEKIHVTQLKADMMADLRTSSDKLSIWEINEETEANDIIMALATGAKVSNTSTTNVVLLDMEALTAANLLIEENESEGDTAITELRKFHRNIINLDVGSLMKLVDLIIDALKKKKVARLTEKKVKSRLLQAIKEKKVNTKYLSSKLRFSLTGEQDFISCPNCQEEILLPIEIQ
jgi:hypothetical protein